MPGNLHMLTKDLNIFRFSFLYNFIDDQVKENWAVYRMVPVPAWLTWKYFSWVEGLQNNFSFMWRILIAPIKKALNKVTSHDLRWQIQNEFPESQTKKLTF